MCWDATQSYPGQPDSPARARLFCTEQLPALLLNTPARDQLIDAAKLVVSELVTNSINAGCDAVRLNLWVHRDRLRLSVLDDAPGLPRLTDPSPTEPHGRGLPIIAELARSWGVTRAATGKEVWVELDIDTELTTALHCHL